MKNILLIFFSLILTNVMSQASAEISNAFVISIQEANQKIPQYVDLDIQNLEFKSQEDLNKFCAKFSGDYQQLSPNWPDKIIRLKLSLSILSYRKMDLQELNEHFLLKAPRMLYVYENL